MQWRKNEKQKANNRHKKHLMSIWKIITTSRCTNSCKHYSWLTAVAAAEARGGVGGVGVRGPVARGQTCQSESHCPAGAGATFAWHNKTLKPQLEGKYLERGALRFTQRERERGRDAHRRRWWINAGGEARPEDTGREQLPGFNHPWWAV